MTTTTPLEDAVPETAPASERPALKPFAAFVQEQRRGALQTELSEALADLVRACVETGKKGKIQLEIAVAPTKDADGTVYITDQVKLSAPRPDARPSMFFTDENGNVSRTNPRQPELPLRPVAGGRSDGDEPAATGTEA